MALRCWSLEAKPNQTIRFRFFAARINMNQLLLRMNQISQTRQVPAHFARSFTAFVTYHWRHVKESLQSKLVQNAHEDSLWNSDMKIKPVGHHIHQYHSTLQRKNTEMTACEHLNIFFAFFPAVFDIFQLCSLCGEPIYLLARVAQLLGAQFSLFKSESGEGLANGWFMRPVTHELALVHCAPFLWRCW